MEEMSIDFHELQKQRSEEIKKGDYCSINVIVGDNEEIETSELEIHTKKPETIIRAVSCMISLLNYFKSELPAVYEIAMKSEEMSSVKTTTFVQKPINKEEEEEK